jgi:hypothetical protein
MDGTKLTPPVIADETGPTDRISLDDEFKVHTWLSNLLVRNGKAHFLYEAQHDPPGQHYVRYDLKTAKRDVDLCPAFKGETLSLLGLDGFFVAGEGSTIFAIGHGKDGGIACLRSDDAGKSWHDFAATDPATVPKKIYAIGGCRWLTADGHIVGTFTDHTDPGPVNVRFLKFSTR